jgi:hypothetical protein
MESEVILKTRLIASFCLAVTLVVLPLGEAAAQAKGSGSYRLALHGGLSYQDFIGTHGADFDSIRQSYFAFLIQKNWPVWNVAFQVYSLSPARLRSFWLNSYTQGEYQVPFLRYQFLGGFRSGKSSIQALLGMETSSWKGSPDLGMKTNLHVHLGLQYSYDLLATASTKLPVVVMLLHHPERKYEFGNYPDSAVVAAPGTELSVRLGLAFDF